MKQGEAVCFIYVLDNLFDLRFKIKRATRYVLYKQIGPIVNQAILSRLSCRDESERISRLQLTLKTLKIENNKYCIKRTQSKIKIVCNCLLHLFFILIYFFYQKKKSTKLKLELKQRVFN